MAASTPGPVTAGGPGSVAAGHDISGPVLTGPVFVGGYERVEDARQYTGGLVAELDLEHFTGRQWLVDQVDEFLRSVDRGYFVLEADAGLGKTAFCAWLASRRGYPAHLVRIPGGADAAAALKNLAAQLIGTYRLDEVAPGGVVPPAAARPDGFARLLAAAAARAQQVAGALVLVVDGLDEVSHRVGEMPLGLPASPPPGVFLVVSRRPGDRMLPIEAPRRYYTLRAWAGPNEPPVPNQQDMLTYLRRVAAEPPLLGLLTDAELVGDVFVDQLAAKCAGVWIYLRYVLEEMRHRRRAVTDLATLPDTLWQYYAYTFARSRQEDPDRWQAVLLPLLATLGAAAEPVPFGLLCALAGVAANDRQRTVLDGPWRPFLQVQGDNLDVEPRYAVYHASLREFLAGRLSEEALAQMTAERPLIRQLRQALRERQSQIAHRYLSAWGGLDSNLTRLHEPADGQLDDGYGLRHLAGHLHAAGRLADLHLLLACQRIEPAVGSGISPRHLNVWFAARDQAGDLGGYLRDVQLAWQAATAATRQDINSGGSASGLGLEIRYALITASMVSLAAAVPTPLITALIKHRLWPTAQALAYSRQLPNPAQRASALAALLPHLAVDQQHRVLAEALAAARQISDEDRRAQALTALAPQLPADLLAEALHAARRISDEDRRAQVLAALAPQLPADLLAEALDAACQNTYEYRRAQALAALAPHLPADLLAEALAEALAAARRISDAYRRAEILTALAPHLPADLLAEAFEAARRISDEGGRSQALAALAPRLPADQQLPVFAEALDAARRISYWDYRAQALAALAPHLPADLFAEALHAARRGVSDEDEWAQMLAGLASQLPADLLAEALDAARRISTKDNRAHVLAGLASQLPADLLVQALDAARWISDEGGRSQVLAALAGQIADLPLSRTITLLQEVLPVLARRSRHEVLTDLRVLLAQPLRAVNGAQVSTTAEAVIAVGQWWP